MQQWTVMIPLMDRELSDEKDERLERVFFALDKVKHFC